MSKKRWFRFHIDAWFKGTTGLSPAEIAVYITVLCEHTHDDIRHPVVWARQTPTSRVVYDGLGHDTASYDSPGHVALLHRAARWLLHDL